LKTKILEALYRVGGQLITLYLDKYIYDIAGFPKILAKDLVRNLESQAMAYKLAPVSGERVEELSYIANGIIQLKTDKEVHYTKTVIVCEGRGAIKPRKLDNPSVNRFEGEGYSIKLPINGNFLENV